MLGIAWPSMRVSLDAPFVGLGVLVAAMTVAQLAAGAASGLLRERLGTIALLLASVAAAAGGLAIFAIASGWWATILASAVLGCGIGILDAAVNTEAALRGDIRFMGALHGAWAIGASLGPPLGGATLVAADPWRPAHLARGTAVAVRGLAEHGRFLGPASASRRSARPSMPRRDALGVRARPSLSHAAADRERRGASRDRLPGGRRNDRWRIASRGRRPPHAVDRCFDPR